MIFFSGKLSTNPITPESKYKSCNKLNRGIEIKIPFLRSSLSKLLIKFFLLQQSVTDLFIQYICTFLNQLSYYLKYHHQWIKNFYKNSTRFTENSSLIVNKLRFNQFPQFIRTDYPYPGLWKILRKNSEIGLILIYSQLFWGVCELEAEWASVLDKFVSL